MKTMKTKRNTTMSVLMIAAVSSFAIAGLSAEVIVDEFIDIPDDKVEVITTEPGTDYVWIPGSWDRDPGKWTWIDGAWKKPPHEKSRWVDGHWKYDDAKWHWTSGQWIADSVGYIVDEIIDVPAVLVDTRPERPSKSHHWVAGYWEWDGFWVWNYGYWILKPDPKAEWVVGHWDPYGVEGWRWIAAHWNVR